MVGKFPTIKSNAQVRTIIDEEGTPWFVARDVSDVLDIPWRGLETLQAIPDHWKGVRKFRTAGGDQAVVVISEAGLYKLAFKSRKPEADKFTNWVAETVLPSIRETGSYTNGNAQVRTIIDEKGEAWFVAQDPCVILGILPKHAVLALYPDEKRRVERIDLGLKPGRSMWLINKPGLYRLIMRSYKPEARKFQHWLAHEVLPQIDKTGAYIPANGKMV